MKELLLVCLLFLPLLATGQKMVITSQRQKGDSLFQTGDIKGALSAYKEVFGRNPRNTTNTYNLACALATDGQQDSAFSYLSLYLKQETAVVNLDMLSDIDFVPLHGDKRWLEVEQDRMARYQAQHGKPVKKEAYALFLLKLYANDQYYRKRLMELEKKSGVLSKQSQNLWQKQKVADKQNQELFLEEVAKNGWPKISDVAKEAATSAFLTVQHSNLQLMQKFLPELKRLCAIDEASWQDYALLYDRVQTMQGKSQLYGSQVFYDEQKKRWSLYPITDEKNLDKRRRELGLPPMKDYVSNWAITYTSKERPVPVVRQVRNYPVDTLFQRGQKIIFKESNFSQTKDGQFPLGWAMSSTSFIKGNSNFFTADLLERLSYITMLNGQKALVVVDSPDAKMWNNSAGFGKVVANGNTLRLPPEFTLECGFLMVDSRRHGGGEFEIFFKDPMAKHKNELNVRIDNAGGFEMNCDADNPALGPNIAKNHDSFYYSYVRSNGKNTRFHKELRGPYPGQYDKNSWHKLALSYGHNQLRCWLDGRFLGSIESCLTPVWFKIYGIAQFGINNIVLASGEAGDELSTLATTKKLVTHSIHFEVNRYEVKEESLAFIRQLAEWMAAHKTARLQIDGHTDATGEPTANMELSRKRAEAIKELLLGYGVSGDRLIAKGFGQTTPLKANITEEGKAMNRRVECVLL